MPGVMQTKRLRKKLRDRNKPKTKKHRGSPLPAAAAQLSSSTSSSSSSSASSRRSSRRAISPPVLPRKEPALPRKEAHVLMRKEIPGDYQRKPPPALPRKEAPAMITPPRPGIKRPPPNMKSPSIYRLLEEEEEEKRRARRERKAARNRAKANEMIHLNPKYVEQMEEEVPDVVEEEVEEEEEEIIPMGKDVRMNPKYKAKVALDWETASVKASATPIAVNPKYRAKMEYNVKKHLSGNAPDLSTVHEDDDIVRLLQSTPKFKSKVKVMQNADDSAYFVLYNGKSEANKCCIVSFDSAMRVVYIRGIKYPNEVNCLMSGTEILKTITSVAKKLDYNYILLQDESAIYADNGTYGYSLAVYGLLKNGYTWYEENDFKQQTNMARVKEFRAFINKLRSTPLMKLDDKLIKKLKHIRLPAGADWEDKMKGMRERLLSILEKNNIPVTETTTAADLLKNVGTENFEVVSSIVNFYARMYSLLSAYTHMLARKITTKDVPALMVQA